MPEDELNRRAALSIKDRPSEMNAVKECSLRKWIVRWSLLLMLFIYAPQSASVSMVRGQTAQDPLITEKIAAGRKLVKEAQELEHAGSALSIKQAIANYEEALLLFRSIAHRPYEAVILHTIGADYSALGEQQKALEYYNQALSLLRAMGDHEHEAVTLNEMGNVYDELGEILKALDYYAQAVRIRRALGDRRGEAITIHNVALLYNHFGQNQRALTLLDKALVMTRAVGDRGSEGMTLSDIGIVYFDLGENQKALAYYTQALPIFRSIPDPAAEAANLSKMGYAYRNLSENQKALDCFNQALAILKTVVDRRFEAVTLNGIAGLYRSVGENQKALNYFSEALTVFRAAGDRRGEGAALANIGLSYRNLGQNEKAQEYYNQALAISVITGDRRGEATTLSNLMSLSRAANPLLAIFYGKQAVNIYQELRSNIKGLDKELQKNFLRTREATYRLLADLLINSGRLPEAQQVLNLFKDQQFFDFNNAERPAASVTLTPHEAVLADKYGRIRTADEVLNVLKLAPTEFRHPASDKEDTVGQVADTRELQAALSELKKQTGRTAVAVYTLIGEDNLRVLLVTPNGITAGSQPIKSDALNEKALQLWGLLQSDAYDPVPLAQELYAQVFKPIESQVPKDVDTILWSLDGNLRYLPMGVLHDGKRYLVERYNHVVFTRADRERLLRTVSPRWTGLGFGSSEAHTVDLLGDKISFNALPGVIEELRTIFRQNGSTNGIIDGDVVSDVRFTKTAMLSALQQRRPLVHISSHFSFRPGDEARSFLLLGDGTAMTLEEMKQHTDLFAGVELLTLSACNTAAQQASGGANGREIDGFAELAQRLGAGAVMATLWPVADNSTPWLMREFYQTRENGSGLTKAEAFRRAQLALLNGTAQTKPLPVAQKGAGSSVQIVIGRKDGPNGGRSDSGSTRGGIVYVAEKDAPLFKRDEKKPFAHPYYWAPFILIGNWK